MKYIKSLTLISGLYLLIVLCLSIFGGWNFVEALNFIGPDHYSSLLIVILLLLISARSTSFFTKDNNDISLYVIPVLGSVAFSIFVYFNSISWNPASCYEGMGCGFNVLGAAGFGILVCLLLVVNNRLLR